MIFFELKIKYFMRNLNIVFVATAFILGIVGAITSIGANRFVANSRVWTINKVICTLFSTGCHGGLSICTTGTAFHRTVFTINSPCTNIFKNHS
jgi:hypothetical protein